MLLAASLELVVGVVEGVHFLVEHIQISQKGTVLFLALDEDCLNFVNIGESRRFLDGVESLIKNAHIALVAVNHFDFFLVIEDDGL